MAHYDWTLDEARSLIAELRPPLFAIGYGIGLTGSTLYDDAGRDLDLMIYALDSLHRAPLTAIHEVLSGAGLVLVYDQREVRKHWRAKGSDDGKHVEIWRTADGRKVDVFILLGGNGVRNPSGYFPR